MPSSDRRRRSRSRSRSASRSRSPRRDRSRSRSRSGSRSRSRDYKRRRYSHSRSRSRSPRRDSRRRSRSRSPPRKSRTPPRRRSPSPRRRSPSPRRPSPPRRPVGPAPPPNYSSSFGSGSSFNAAPSAGAPAFPDGREPSPPPPTVSNGGGIDFDQYENIPVETSGRDCPPPIDSFADCDLGPELMANIVRVNYKKPTPVQKYALPIVLRGRDLMGCAQTGSGKTAAFLFPTLSLLMRGGRPSSGGRAITPSLVVLAPTRELAIQICDEAKKFTHNTWIKVCIVYGGAPMGLQLRELERGCDVIIGTPGRMNDIMTRGRISMSRVKFLILDEADRMLDMGFEPQIRKIVEQSDMPRTGHRRTLMFSATFPKEIQRLAASFLYDYIFLAVGRVGSATDLVKQHFVRVDDSYNGKQTALLQLLKQNSSGGLTLVFTETKRECSSLAHFLYRQGYPATSIHGDRTQAEREDALRSFGSGRTPILVATNVAARGLDINDITHVINYDMPNDIDEYVHRIGRTGRAGKKGLATSLIGRDGTKFGQKLLELLHEGKQEIPEWLVSMAGSFDFRGGGRGKKHNFGGRDFRRKEGFDFSAPHPPASSSSSAYTPVGAAPSYQQPSLQSAVYQPQQQAYPQPNAFAPPQAAAGAWGGYMPQYR